MIVLNRHIRRPEGIAFSASGGDHMAKHVPSTEIESSVNNKRSKREFPQRINY